MSILKRLLSALFLLLALPAAGQERSLSWDEIAVNAHLDARGTLHVRERQTFVFTGDWNGGERSFRVALNQDLELEGLYRVAEDGREVQLVEGDIDKVDHYAWADGHTLRWRSRLPSDPPFDNTVKTYVIAYSLSGILTPDGDDWLLNHDFSLPNAEWPIESLVVDLDLDPAWQPLDETPTRFTRRQLMPGESVVVRKRLRHTGSVPVEGVAIPAPLPLRRGLFAATLLIMAALYVRFRKAEVRRGRFEPLPHPPDAAWDEAWLRENVFDLKAEEVGALWDQAIGPPEVAAVLARMVAEGKMTSEVRPGFTLFGKALTPGVLHLRLTTPRAGLPGYERELVDKLFFDGDDTDTDRVKQRYRRTGFNPAGVIEKPLRAALSSHGELGRVPAPSRRPTLFLTLAVLALFGIEAARNPAVTAVLFAMTLFLLLWPTGLGLIAAFAWRKRTEHLDAVSLTFLIPGLIAWGICLALAFLPLGGLTPGLFALLGLGVAPLAVWNSLLNNARSRESDETIRKRRILAAARHLFRRELQSENPRLRDEWLPYLLAFGLGTNVDRWFRSFGDRSARGISTMSTGSAGGSGGSIGGGWSGGGGSFGGAGATGAWAVAATGLASGVSAPSSSGGGGGGGGGGSSSGGGGGGGW